jgi:small subunit ribosomal protein S1
VKLASQEKIVEPKTLKDLKRGMKIEGKVTKTELYGAFVDVGLDRDGLIHISQLKQGRVNRVEDVVQEGDTIEAWVHHIDVDRGRLELTLIRPVELDWRDIKTGMRVPGKVVRLENFGAFVDIGAERPGLVHISEMSEGYVKSPRDVVSEGDEVEVTVLDFDRKKRQISLSMKDSGEMEVVEDIPVEEPATAMEVALKAALEKAKEEQPKKGQAVDQGTAKKSSHETQEEILQRTLEQRLESSKS